ncbi:MAG: ClC family H(+)/Cl(-) exchange transporter [Candidatus Nanopelagicales bacterium]
MNTPAGGSFEPKDRDRAWPSDAPPPDDSRPTGLWRLGLLAVVGGAITGAVGGLFRLSLVEADALRTDLVQWARSVPGLRWIVPVVLAAVAVAIARLIVRFVPEASGSGVQRVEANMRSEVPVASLWVLPAKFIGGALAIGSGLALGREGPTVQMGASIGGEMSRRAKLDAHDTRTVAASLAGAGLGVAFSAPIGGALFVFEEVARAFRTRLLVATFLGTGTAVAVAQMIVGRQPVFPFLTAPTQEPWKLFLFAGMGLLLGLLGPAYNKLILLTLDLFDAVRGARVEVKAAAVGALVGLLGFIAPSLVGGGDALNEEVLLGRVSIAALLVVVVVRWLLGPISYSVGTPGGLFAPLLLVGAAIGALLANLVNVVVPAAGLSVTAFAIVGMSTFFAAVVRAPFTGVVLIVEMAATTALLVPMILAAACAVLVATAVKGPPIYETLRLRMEGR